jgi:predicted aminopeptidase
MRSLISIPLLLLVCGCADLGYYWHNTRGHLALMNQRIDIEDMLVDDEIDAQLRQRLQLVQEIRQFSIERLGLPENGSYASYVQLDRPWVVQNLFAAAEFSTQLQQWCYPFIGCASYRGYYDDARLQAYIEELESQDLEIYVGKVAAYSTLGWFDDPVLSSFIDWPEHRLAGLLFHELTHQRIYIDDDTSFNESLASAVQQVGTRLWLESRSETQALQKMSRWLAYREQVIALIVTTRAELTELYASDLDETEKRQRKARRFDVARAAHDDIAAKHGIPDGYRSWFAGEINNAKIGSVAEYNSHLEAFVRMLDAHGHAFPAFFRYVETLAEFDRDARGRCLEAWQKSAQTNAGVCPPHVTGDA